MDNLLKTEKDVWHYLCRIRGEIAYKASEAMDLNNPEGAKLMQIAVDSISACMKALEY